MKMRKTKKFFLPFVALMALALAVPFLTLNHRVSADAGSVFTTMVGCIVVNGNNTYMAKSDVYLRGSNLPAGDYYVQVTNPSGSVVLGRTFPDKVTVSANGELPCSQLTAILYTGPSGSTPHGYDDTPNHGAVYKAWVSMDPSFAGDNTKTDNFKVKSNGSLIGGVKYEDVDASGTLTAGDKPIENVTISVTTPNDVTPMTTTTDSTGVWALTLPAGTTYTACEALLLSTPYTQTGPTSGVQTNDTFATANASKCWVGTVGNSDTLDLNFFNVVCQPVIACPNNIEANADANCQATVTYTTPTATDNCSGLVPYNPPTVSCTPASGSPFPLGTTTVTCTATDGVNPVNKASCSFTVTVVDKTPPTLSVPQKVEVCTLTVSNGSCSAAARYSVSATDNCDSANAITIECSPVSGSIFPLGTTTVTCTATDAHLNKSSSSFPVIVNDCSVGSISGKKSYDANGPVDGTNGSQIVKGYKIMLTKGVTPMGTIFTDSNGNYTFTNLSAGTYTVSEIAPGTSWVATKATSYMFTVSCSNTSNAFSYDFCNYCKVPSGGLTLGFWSNKNGQNATTAVDLCYLNSLSLRNANGSDFNPVPADKCLNPASPTLTSAQITAGKTALSNWLLAANAVNMANMLSAQLTAMELNVRRGNVNGNVYTLCYNGTINDLMAAARASLTANPITNTAGPIRTYQESLKNCLDALNNNGLVVSLTPCPFTSPY